MNLEEIRETLDQALDLQPPVWDPVTEVASKKSERLEDYLLKSARAQADLVAARHWLRAMRAKVTSEWENLTGWESAARKSTARMTKGEVEEAKRQVAPQLFDAYTHGKQLADSVDDQIARLEREERALSRIYTIFSA